VLETIIEFDFLFIYKRGGIAYSVLKEKEKVKEKKSWSEKVQIRLFAVWKCVCDTK